MANLMNIDLYFYKFIKINFTYEGFFKFIIINII